MNRFLVFTCLFGAASAVGFGLEGYRAGCNDPNPHFGPPNLYPILDGSQTLTLLNTTTNGKLYQAAVPHDGGNTSSTFYVIHVWGKPYDWGFAQGSLLRGTANTFIETTWKYMEGEVESAISFFPKWLQEDIANLGLDAALDLTADITRAYTPSFIFDELHGIADGSGISYRTLLRVHMIAGLTQGKCSMLGAWGSALAANSTTKLLQLRALDWDMDGPFRDYSAITVYHPDEGYGNELISVGMTGFIGGLTGFSSAQLAISEIGVSYPDDTFGSESRIGLPFIFLLREILQFDLTIDDAINRMANAKRTCDLILGVGDGKMTEFRGFEYSSSVLDVIDDRNLRPYNETWHPRIPDVVYWGMDWMCPGYNLLLSSLLKQYYGQITAELAIHQISPGEQSGSNHIAYYDLTNSQIYVSFAAPHAVGGKLNAYERQYTQFNASLLFAEKHP
eukprot:TRINITY_DN6884_c0_g5_i1.p1 TRINITY_DN6884_c0_g5~~TRINITY_DN6884_c0_g5_i1.p1  ORF type:complete len:449 (+),score=180.95 TRINITY_DN6884_c0_g5_i1:148-1494(+)